MNSKSKLQDISNIKEEIKSILANKGLEPTNSFATYPNLINNMSVVTASGIHLYDTIENMTNDTSVNIGEYGVVYSNVNDVTSFNGLYQYNNGWKLAPTQLTVNDMDVVSGTYYGANGVSNGYLGTLTYYDNSANSLDTLSKKLFRVNRILHNMNFSNLVINKAISWGGEQPYIIPPLYRC